MNFYSSDFKTVVFSKEAIKHCQTISRMFESCGNDSQAETIILPFTKQQLEDASSVLHNGSYGALPLPRLFQILAVLDYLECSVHLTTVAEHIAKEIDQHRTRLELSGNKQSIEELKTLIRTLYVNA